MENKHLQFLIFRLERLQPIIIYYFKNWMEMPFIKSILSEPAVSFTILELHSFFDRDHRTASLIQRNFLEELNISNENIDKMISDIESIIGGGNFIKLKKLRNNISAHKNTDVGIGNKSTDKLTPEQLEFLYLQLFHTIDKYIDITSMMNYEKIKSMQDDEHLSDII